MAGETERRMWTCVEVRRAVDMRQRGWSHVRIGRELNRSRGSVATMFRDLLRRDSRRPARVLRKCDGDAALSALDDAAASEMLRTATLRALLAHAKRARVDIDTAARKLISEGVMCL